MDTEQALHEMGYRPVDSRRRQWAKPVGYSIYVFDVDESRWDQRFKAASDGTTHVNSSASWNRETTLVDFLAHAETWHSKTIIGADKGRFVWHFSTEIQIPV